MKIALLLIVVALPAWSGDLPDPRLTPGQTRTDLSPAKVCTIAWGKDRRHVTPKMKAQVLAAYHMTPKSCPSRRIEIDHLIGRELLGADVVANLWPQCYEKPVKGKRPLQTDEWGAHKKDRLENYLHREACAGRLTLAGAQHELATDWIAAYRKYFPR